LLQALKGLHLRETIPLGLWQGEGWRGEREEDKSNGGEERVGRGKQRRKEGG